MIDPGHPSNRILLIGMMGAGKSTVGSLLARRLGWTYVDSDAQVQAATGQTVPELFGTRGEAVFRRAETVALRTALSGGEPMVVSVAGGAVLDPDNRELVRNGGLVVWLRARPETLRDRVGDGRGRPLLDNDPASALVRLDRERRPLYDAVADAVVDVDELSAQEVVGRVLSVWDPDSPRGEAP